VTEGVRILTGDPKKAIIKLSIPMMLGMLLQTVYNLADAIWVSGLGYEALSAIGIFFPVFMALISISSGISIGVSSAVSRRIGARDRSSANKCASYGITLSIILGIFVSLALLFAMDVILEFLEVERSVATLTLIYSRIIASGSLFLVFSFMLSGILRGEGDAKRSTYTMAVGSILNIILDPIFIYLLNLGIAGAAYATVLSMMISCMLSFYWMFVKKNTFVRASLMRVSFDAEMREILRVGIPSSMSQLSMSIASFILNAIILSAGGEEGVAIFTSSWRISTFGIVPLIGMASATTAVTAALYGAREGDKLSEAYLYSVKLAFLIELFLSVFIIASASQISKLFTYSIESKIFSEELTRALRILALFLPSTPFGMMTSSMFQGIGKGERALAVTITRSIILQLAFVYLLLRILNTGLQSIWIGMVLGNTVAAFIAFSCGILTVRSLRGVL